MKTPKYTLKNMSGRFARIDGATVVWERVFGDASLMDPETITWVLKTIMLVDDVDHDVFTLERAL